MTTACSKCNSNLIMSITAHGRDANSLRFKGVTVSGYLPHDLGVGGGDDLDIDLCLNCGQVQNFSPVSETQIIASLCDSFELSEKELEKLHRTVE